MRTSKKTKPFLCSYFHDGTEWSVTLHAYNKEDAISRVKKLGNMRYDGEIFVEIPTKIGLVARVVCAFRNAIQSS